MAYFKNSKRGFSLVILAVFIALAGILLIVTMPSPLQQRETELKNEKEKMRTIMNALLAYSKAHDGDYPQPARYDLATSHADFAKEDTSTCAAGQIICDGDVKIGALPTKTLGLADSYVFDKWNARYTYAMDTTGAALTVSSLANTTPIEDSTGEEVAIVVLSHGPDNIGAFGRNGSQIATCSRAGANSGAHALSELENCDDDGIFIFDKWNTADATFYDDLTGIIFKAPDDTSGTPFIAVAHNLVSNKCFTVYNANTWAKSNVPNCNGSGNGSGAEFNHDFTRLAISHRGNNPYFNVYEYDEPTDTWSAISTGAISITTTSLNDIAYSPDPSRYLAVTRNTTSPRLFVIDTVDWDLETVASPPASNAEGTEFSPNGKYLAVTMTSAPYVSLYDSTDGWNRLSPAVAENPGFSAKGVSFHPNGVLAVSHTCNGGSPERCVTIYPNMGLNSVDWSGKITTPAFGDGMTVGRGISYSDDGKFLAVGGTTGGGSPSLYVFDTTDSYSSVTIDEVPSGVVHETVFSVGGYDLTVGHTNEPYITRYTYNSVSDTFEKVEPDLDDPDWPGGDVLAITSASIVSGGGGGGGSPGESTGWYLNF